MVYPPEDGHPSGTNRAGRALTSFMRRTPLTTTPRRQGGCTCSTGLNWTGLKQVDPVTRPSRRVHLIGCSETRAAGAQQVLDIRVRSLVQIVQFSWCSVNTPIGKHVFRTPVGELNNSAVNFTCSASPLFFRSTNTGPT